LRAGFVTEAALRKVSLADTMAMTGHQSVAVVLGYQRHGETSRSAASNLLGEISTGSWRLAAVYRDGQAKDSCAAIAAGGCNGNAHDECPRTAVSHRYRRWFEWRLY